MFSHFKARLCPVETVAATQVTLSNDGCMQLVHATEPEARGAMQNKGL